MKVINEAWYLEIEQEMIKKYGGVADRSHGHDGCLGKLPLEVKAVKQDHRFRINKKPHHKMLREDGQYIFVVVGSIKKSKILTAKAVDHLLRGCCWFTDREFPHKFLTIDKVFN